MKKMLVKIAYVGAALILWASTAGATSYTTAMSSSVAGSVSTPPSNNLGSLWPGGQNLDVAGFNIAGNHLTSIEIDFYSLFDGKEGLNNTNIISTAVGSVQYRFSFTSYLDNPTDPGNPLALISTSLPSTIGHYTWAGAANAPANTTIWDPNTHATGLLSAGSGVLTDTALLAFFTSSGNVQLDAYISGTDTITSTKPAGIFNGSNMDGQAYFNIIYGYDKNEPPAVPEPGTLLLLGAGLVGMGIAAKVRRTA
jgi:hypothetical protein